MRLTDTFIIKDTIIENKHECLWSYFRTKTNRQWRIINQVHLEQTHQNI